MASDDVVCFGHWTGRPQGQFLKFSLSVATARSEPNRAKPDYQKSGLVREMYPDYDWKINPKASWYGRFGGEGVITLKLIRQGKSGIGLRATEREIEREGHAKKNMCRHGKQKTRSPAAGNPSEIQRGKSMGVSGSHFILHSHRSPHLILTLMTLILFHHANACSLCHHGNLLFVPLGWVGELFHNNLEMNNTLTRW